MSAPRISVIIPTYDRAALVGETIECMLRQTLTPHELIVVDDGSTDDTVAVVRSFGDRVLLIEQDNAGPGAARNTGFARATGEFVQFFDSDDLATFDKLEVQARTLVETGCDIAYSPWVQAWFADAEVRIGRHVYQQHPVPRDPLSAFLRGWVLFMPACLMRRTVVAQVGCYPTGMRTGEDLELLMRLILAGARFTHAPGPVLLVRQHPENQISAAAELGDARAAERVQLIATVDRLLAEAQIRPPTLDGLLWRTARWEANRARGHGAEDRPAEFRPEPIVARVRQIAAGLRVRLGGTRLGGLFAPAAITPDQARSIGELGYRPIVA